MGIATRDDLSPGLEALEVAHVVALSVLDDMRLLIEPVEVARSGEHNSATFRIVQQPASLDQYVCRAEVQTSEGTTYRLVVDGEFSLTADVAVQGINRLQLVYSDGVDLIRKTYQAPFHVSASVNAVDESDPDFQNGLAQLQLAAFAGVSGSDDGITFYNVSNQPVGAVFYPPSQGGGDLTEARADTLYLRLNGAGVMQGSVAITGPNRGMIWEEGGRQGAFYSTGTQIVLRLGEGDLPFAIEPNSGSVALRSAVITQVSGDARYVQPPALDAYLLRAGGQMTGVLVTQNGSSNTNPGIAIGENSSGFWRSSLYLICTVGGQTAWQSSGTEMMLGVRLNAATQQITNVGDPTAAADAVNRRTMDAAIAAIPRPAVPVSRIYIPNEVTVVTTATEFFSQPFFTSDNTARTIVVTVYPQFAEGTPSAFYDLEYTTGLSVGLVERSTVYPTAQGYMGGGQAVCFGVTVTPVGNQIQVSLSVRQMSNNPGALIQIGSRATQRSYVLIQEMTN